MHIVKIYNNGVPKEIHGYNQKLKSGKVVKGINAIDSFSFTMLPSNAGFNQLYEKKTLVSVYNTNKNRYEFYGRVLYSNPSMSEDGKIQKEVVCESYFGFLCDSEQHYVEEQNWTVTGLLTHIVNEHNSQLEDYKHFAIGEVTVEDPNDNLYCGIQRKNTWETIKEKLLNVLGGEIRFRVVDEVIYLDYLKEIGTTKSTAIKLSRNMKAITKEKDPSSFVSRLRPLGCKLTTEKTVTDAEGNETTETVETEQRLDITSVNNGLDYILDEVAEAEYGISVRSVEWDDVTTASNLLTKGQNWLAENNKVQVRYSITSLDLSLLGLDIDDFDVYNKHPIKNALLGIDDIARIIKKTIDICEEVQSTIEVGENFKTLSDIQIEQAGKLDTATNTIQKIEADYVTNQILTSTTTNINSLIQQTAENILFMVSSGEVTVTPSEEYRQSIETELQILSDEILMKFTTTTEQITNVDGDLQTKFEELYKYISFAGGSIKLGSSDSEITLTIENDMLQFKRNGVTFGSWDGEYFYTGNIVVQVNERAQFGNFAYIPRSDGSLSFLKVDGVGAVARTLLSISATYNGGSVPAGTKVNDLTNLTVVATYSDNSTKTVSTYNLSGEINVGTNIITVSFGGKTTTFTVVGEALSNELVSVSATYSGGSVPVGTLVESLSGIEVTARWSDGSTSIVTDYTLSGSISEGENEVWVLYGGKIAIITVVGVASASNEITLGEKTTCVVKFWMSNTTSGSNVEYASDVQVVDGIVELVNPMQHTFYMVYSGVTNDYTVLLGKYVKSANGDIYFIDTDSTYTHNTNVTAYVVENLIYNSAHRVDIAA